MFRTEFEFTLPCGYLDEEGNLHRQGLMRRATAADEIHPLRDPRVVKNEAYLIVILLSLCGTALGLVVGAVTGLLGQRRLAEALRAGRLGVRGGLRRRAGLAGVAHLALDLAHVLDRSLACHVELLLSGAEPRRTARRAAGPDAPVACQSSSASGRSRERARSTPRTSPASGPRPLPDPAPCGRCRRSPCWPAPRAASPRTNSLVPRPPDIGRSPSARACCAPKRPHWLHWPPCRRSMATSPPASAAAPVTDSPAMGPLAGIAAQSGSWETRT